MKKIITLENFIWLIILVLPVYLIRFPGFNLLDILIGVAFIWWLKTDSERLGRTIGFIRQNKVAVAGFGLVMAGLLGGLWKTDNVWLTLGIIKSWFLLPFMLGFLFRVVISEERRKRLFFTFFLSALFLSLISWAFYFSGNLTFDGRLSAFFNSPNYLFMFLAAGFLSGLSWIISVDETAKKKGLIGVGLLSILAILFLTKSYSGIVALSVAMLFLGKKVFFRWRFALGLFLFLSSFLFFEGKSDKFSDLIRLDDRSSLASREIIWKASFQIIEDNWFLGIGAGNFQEKYLEYQKFFPPYLEWAVPHPHNLFLSFWLNSGLIGLLGFGIILWNWVRISHHKNKKLLWGASAIMLYFLLHGLLDTSYFKNDLACLFWLVYFL